MRRVMGMMSGTSMDGIDAAILETDGESIGAFGADLFLPYDDEIRGLLRELITNAPRFSDAGIARAEKRLTELHAEAARALSAKNGAPPSLIGFHGHTIWHNPQKGETRQIGDPQMLARLTGLEVVGEFRLNDVAHGGEGAPLAPLYHRALAHYGGLPLPLAVLNLGGVGNVTWMDSDEILAFDTGTGNALLDDWVFAHIGAPYDEGGALASKGRVIADCVEAYSRDPYFARDPPKSLDRNAFSLAPLKGASLEDGAATLAHFTAEGVFAARAHFPRPPKAWIVTGGGRLNGFLMELLRRRLAEPLMTAEEARWNGDMIEAQAFAYLARRSVEGLPLSFPQTTGAPRPLSGGRLFHP